MSIRRAVGGPTNPSPSAALQSKTDQKTEQHSATETYNPGCLDILLIAGKLTLLRGESVKREGPGENWEKVQVLRICRGVGVVTSRVIRDEYRI